MGLCSDKKVDPQWPDKRAVSVGNFTKKAMIIFATFFALSLIGVSLLL
jgi:hypothetical protein